MTYSTSKWNFILIYKQRWGLERRTRLFSPQIITFFRRYQYLSHQLCALTRRIIWLKRRVCREIINKCQSAHSAAVSLPRWTPMVKCAMQPITFDQMKQRNDGKASITRTETAAVLTSNGHSWFEQSSIAPVLSFIIECENVFSFIHEWWAVTVDIRLCESGHRLQYIWYTWVISLRGFRSFGVVWRSLVIPWRHCYN